MYRERRSACRPTLAGSSRVLTVGSLLDRPDNVLRRLGRYEVRVQAKNTRGVQSAWSPALVVKVVEEDGAGKNRRGSDEEV